MNALEMACWDIVGKAVDQPVYNLIGGQVNEKLRTYSYLYTKQGDIADVYTDPDLAAERAAEYVEWGFTGVKYDPVGPYTAAYSSTRWSPHGCRLRKSMTALVRCVRGCLPDRSSCLTEDSWCGCGRLIREREPLRADRQRRQQTAQSRLGRRLLGSDTRVHGHELRR
jgi:L-alanine-DL-glutamate epimerase-like enolase superfamily enzyme